MDEDLKESLKKIGKNAELKLTESVLRWKYRKEGKTIPDDENIGEQSKAVADQAHKIILNRGKNVLSGLRQAYQKRQKKEDLED